MTTRSGRIFNPNAPILAPVSARQARQAARDAARREEEEDRRRRDEERRRNQRRHPDYDDLAPIPQLPFIDDNPISYLLWIMNHMERYFAPFIGPTDAVTERYRNMVNNQNWTRYWEERIRINYYAHHPLTNRRYVQSPRGLNIMYYHTYPVVVFYQSPNPRMRIRHWIMNYNILWTPNRWSPTDEEPELMLVQLDNVRIGYTPALLDPNVHLWPGYEPARPHFTPSPWVEGTFHNFRSPIDNNGESHREVPLWLFWVNILTAVFRNFASFVPYQRRHLNNYSIQLRFYNPYHPIPLQFQTRTYSFSNMMTWPDFVAVLYDALISHEVSDPDNVRQRVRSSATYEEINVNWYIDTSWFGFIVREDLIQNYRRANATEFSKFIIYETDSDMNPLMPCINEAMRKCGYDYPSMSDSVDELIEYIKANDLPIDILHNIPSRTAMASFSNKTITIDRKKIKVFRFLNEQVEHREIYKCGRSMRYTLIYDIENKHIEKAQLPLRLKMDVYCHKEYIVRVDPDSRIIAIINSPQPVVDTTEMPIDPVHSPLLIFMRTECVMSFGAEHPSSLLPFAVTYMVSDDLVVDKIDANRVLKPITILGKDCYVKFCKVLEEFAVQEPNRQISVIGYGNSRVDNIFLLYEMANHRFLDRCSIKYANFENANSIRSMLFHSRTVTIDFKNHVKAHSLFDLAYDMNIKHDYDTLSSLHIDRHLQHSFQESNYDTVDYDTLGLAVERLSYCVCILHQAYHIYHNTIMAIPCVQKAFVVNSNMSTLSSCLSLPKFMFRVFESLNKGIHFPTINLNQYEFMKRDAVGGRVCFNNADEYSDDQIVSLDVTSLYPYIMAIHPDIEFPVGGKPIDERVDKDRAASLTEQLQRYAYFNYFGYAEVDIDQSNLVRENKPLIRCFKGMDANSYEYTEDVIKQIQVCLHTSDIFELREAGVEVVIHEGYRTLFFPNRISGEKLFSWVSDIMILKNAATDRCSRRIYKNMLNFMSGILFTNLSDTKYAISTRQRVHDKTGFAKRALLNSIKTMTVFENENVIVQYKVDLSTSNFNSKRFIGSIIYSAARRYMYKHILKYLTPDEILYMDTDAVKMKITTVNNKLRHLSTDLIPHNHFIRQIDPRYANSVLFQKESIFGGFVNEFPDNFNRLIVLGGKRWGAFYINPDLGIATACKMAHSGISNTAIYIPESDYIRVDFIDQPWAGYFSVTDQAKAHNYYLLYFSHRVCDIHRPHILYQMFKDSVYGKRVVMLDRIVYSDIATRAITYKYVIKYF